MQWTRQGLQPRPPECRQVLYQLSYCWNTSDPHLGKRQTVQYDRYITNSTPPDEDSWVLTIIIC